MYSATMMDSILTRELRVHNELQLGPTRRPGLKRIGFISEFTSSPTRLGGNTNFSLFKLGSHFHAAKSSSFLQVIMKISIAGPSRLRPPTVPVERDRDNYEQELTRIVAGITLADIEQVQAIHETKLSQGQDLSDRELAFRLFLQNVQENAQLDADLAIALALAEDGEPVPAPR